MVVEKCKLCLQEKPLCKSHIVPEFCYESLYDKDHRFIEMTDVDKGKVRKGQKGYWERLLCQDCESLLNRYERHARRMFTDALPAIQSGRERRRQFVSLQYTATKLFFLSILWRASVAKQDTYKHVSLGPHEEIIRQMIINGDAGPMGQYATVLFTLHFKKEQLKDFMVEPTYMRWEGQKCYRLVVNGFVIFILVSSQPMPEKLKHAGMSPEHPIVALDADLSEFGFLRETWNRAGQSTRHVVL